MIAIEQEIANYEKQLRQSYFVKSRLMDELEKRQIIESLISEIQVYEEHKENG